MSGAVLIDVEVCAAIASSMKANNHGAVFRSRVPGASRRDVVTTRNGRIARKVKFEGLHVVGRCLLPHTICLHRSEFADAKRKTSVT
ncbi:alpha beta hydrolase fold protein [Colletotrichum asianum]